jgi:hypothetical protein
MSGARWRAIIVVVLVFSLVGVAPGFAVGGAAFDVRPTVIAQEPSGAEMLVDIALVRPISFVGLLIGCVAWVVAAPLALIADGSEGLDSVSRKLVEAPAKYTFVRSVGEF